MSNLIFRFKDKSFESGGKTKICSIVNVTPDSFSDGGKYYGKEKAIKHALDLVENGADILDIGGESTRPGSTPVDSKDEINRIVPVIKGIKKLTDTPISVDTWKADVAQAAIDAGADIINDITGLLGDPKMAQVIGNSDAGAILMFNPVIARPEHPGSKIFPKFGENPFSKEELESFKTMDINNIMDLYFKKSLDRAEKANLDRERIMLDPGIGFGLTKKENLILIRDIEKIHRMGHQIFLGVSRKRFICNILEENGFNIDPDTEEGFRNRDYSSAFLTGIASFLGVDVVRVHSLEEHKMASIICDSIRLADQIEDTNLGAYKNK